MLTEISVLLHLDISCLLKISLPACSVCIRSQVKYCEHELLVLFIGLDRLLTVQQLPVINGHSSHPADELKIGQVILITQT